MPILFKQHQRLQSSQRFTPDRPQPRRLLNAPGTAIRRLSIRLSEGRGRLQAGSRVRAGLRRHSIRARRSARRSISRLRRHGSSIRKYFRDPKLLCQLVKYIYKRRHLNHLIPLIFVMLYMLIGAFLFNWLETAAEKDRILAKNVDYERERSLFVKRMEEIVVDLAARDPGRRREHVAEAVDHLSWKLSHELASKEEEWSLSTSMYFAGTIFTTIGYGDVACATFTGRMATVLYAIFGIPLMLCTWNEMGKFLYKTINEFMAALTGWCERSSCFTKLRQKIVAKCCCLCKKEQKGEEEDDVEKGNAVMNGKLPSSHHRRHHKREHSKAVNFKLSMQMPAVTAVEDNAQFREALEEKLEEAKRRSRRRMEKKGDEVQSDDDDDNDEEEEESEEDEEVESAAAEHSQESETIYDNLMAETKAGDRGKEEEEKESEEEEGSASGGSSSSSSASSSSDDERSEEEEEQAGDGFYGDFDGLLEEPKEEEAPRMHVLVAIGSTFAWVFFCAALFQFWEEWSYWESLYFMFISLLTVGLGDINVRRRDLMVVCFIFVIIGLSLVSMCIMVIQSSLEDLYRRLLMKMVTDYQVKLSRDARRNSGAVPWKAFGRESKAAKYLLPILSDNTKRSLMQQVKEDARDSGMQIPVAFDDFTSLNEIIEKDITEDEREEEQESKEPAWLPPVANGILKRTQEPPPIAKSASFSGFLLDIHTQTDCLRSFDAFGQTEETKFNDRHAQTEQSATADWLRKKAAVGVHTGQQTEGPPRVNKKIQSAILRLRDGQTMTEGLCGSRQIQKNAEAQTEEHLRADAQCQTRAPVDFREMAEKEAQTYKFMKSRRIQTPVPLLYDQQTQTIDTDLRGRLYPSVSMLRLFLSPIETMQN